MIKPDKKMLAFILVVGVIVAVRFSPLSHVLTLENLKQERTHLLVFVHDHYMLSVLVYIMAYVLVSVLAVPGAGILTIAGGATYGTLVTAVYTNVGATTGASLAFLASRYLFGNRLQRARGEQLHRFNKAMERNGPRYLISLRLVPVFPFFLINILAGLTRVSLTTFMWTTALGIVPGTLLFAYTGQQIGSINAPADIFSTRIILAFAALIAVTLLPALLNRMKPGRNGHQENR